MILYFTGTGNSRRCALRLGELLCDSDVRELRGEMLLNPSAASIATEGKRIIWVFPTYSWGVPPVIARFIKGARFGKGAQKASHYMVTTCGDDTAYTDRQWLKLLKARGLDARTAFSVIMPNTYTLMKGFDVDSPELAARKLEESEERLKEIAERIENGGEPLLTRGAFPWVKSRIIYPWFKRFSMSPKPFHATEACIGCELCARSCPMKNITMIEGKPAWGDACALCLRCYHACPRRAVAYGKATDGKGQYMCPTTRS